MHEITAEFELRPDDAILTLQGRLTLRSSPAVRRVLAKLLASRDRVLVDASGLELGWPHAAQLFPAVLATAGGWPAKSMVLFGAGATLTRALHAQRVPLHVPVVADLAAAARRATRRPGLIERSVPLPADLTAPARAREFVRAGCVQWELPECRDDAVLLASELVTNAVQHGGGAVTLTMRSDPRGLWIEVRDGGSTSVPRLRPRAVGADGGRGLQVVALLATSWGVRPDPGGKTVWALLPTGCAFPV